MQGIRTERRRLLAEANRARNAGRNRRAIALYRRLLLEEPDNVEVALRAAPLMAAYGEAFEAWQLFRGAAARLRRERRYEACLAALRDACRCVPLEFDAWEMRADLELELGREETAYETLLEGRRRFDAPRTAAQAIALLKRARAIEPWDCDVTLDLAHLYARTEQNDVAYEMLASLAPHAGGRELRRVRWIQWRITFSLRHLWMWIESLLGESVVETESERLFAVRDPLALERLRGETYADAAPEPEDDCLLLEHEVSA